MNKVFSTVWCAIRRCFMVTNEFCRRRGRQSRSGVSITSRATIFILASSLVNVAYTGELTFPYLENVTTSATASITEIPAAGPNGAAGSPGGYSCNQMTWGEACAAFYSYGSYT